jgi:hypothetical protein
LIVKYQFKNSQKILQGKKYDDAISVLWSFDTELAGGNRNNLLQPLQIMMSRHIRDVLSLVNTAIQNVVILKNSLKKTNVLAHTER